MRKMDSILTRMSFGKIAKRVFSLLVVLVTAANTLAIPVSAVFDGMPICGMQEHTHSDACYTANSTVVCGSEESAEHTHSEGCYLSESVLSCQVPEHTHTPVCYLQQPAGNDIGGVESNSDSVDNSQDIPVESDPSQNVPSEDNPSQDVPTQDNPTQDVPSENDPSHDDPQRMIPRRKIPQ